jgi:hypothetical protein
MDRGKQPWPISGFFLDYYLFCIAPAFGGVDLGEFRRQWGAWFWLDAVTFSILSAACATDLAVRRVMARARRHRQRERHRYLNIYAPLFAELIKIHIITSSAVMAATMWHRLENARTELTARRRRRAAIRSAWRSLFDRKQRPETGEVAYGGEFPIREINRVVQSNLFYCDDELLNLVSRAVATRIEDGSRPGELTSDDVRVHTHIIKERDRLRKLLSK